jgi:hypothetical protein
MPSLSAVISEVAGPSAGEPLPIATAVRLAVFVAQPRVSSR